MHIKMKLTVVRWVVFLSVQTCLWYFCLCH